MTFNIHTSVTEEFDILFKVPVTVCCDSQAFIGSKGEKPKLAANLGMFGFHLGPNN